VKVIENVTIQYRAYDYLMTFYSNYMYVSVSCRFRDIQCRNTSRP